MEYKRKLYISDLDGTLLNSDKEISGYTRDIINAHLKRGGHFSVATARSAASAVNILSCLDLDIPVILMNGVAIYDLKKLEYVKSEEIPESTAEAIVRVFEEYDVTGFMYTIHGNELVTYFERLCTEALEDFYNERVSKYYKRFEQTDSFIDSIKGNKVIYFTLIDTRDALSVVRRALEKLEGLNFEFYRDIYSEDLWYLEIFNKNASKRNAVEFIRKHSSFDHITGFGDNYNDIPFSEACDEFYAVAGAVPELKEKAAGVIGGCSEDGVARFIALREGYTAEPAP